MAIRTPGHPESDVLYIKFKFSDGTVRNIARVVRIINGECREIWGDDFMSTFLDCFGNVFYDSDGVPFQGRQD